MSMSWERQKTIVVRCTAVSAVATGLFWGIWYLITGSVPVTTEIRLTPEEVWHLPFAVSRLLDILFAPVFVSIIVMIFTSASDDVDLVTGLVTGLAYGLVAGLVFGLVFGLGFGLVAGLAYGLAYGLVVVLRLVFSSGPWRKARDWLTAQDRA